MWWSWRICSSYSFWLRACEGLLAALWNSSFRWLFFVSLLMFGFAGILRISILWRTMSRGQVCLVLCYLLFDIFVISVSQGFVSVQGMWWYMLVTECSCLLRVKGFCISFWGNIINRFRWNGSLLVVVIVIAFLTFQIAINPIGGVWQANPKSVPMPDEPKPGTSIFAYDKDQKPRD